MVYCKVERRVPICLSWRNQQRDNISTPSKVNTQERSVEPPTGLLAQLQIITANIHVDRDSWDDKEEDETLVHLTSRKTFFHIPLNDIQLCHRAECVYKNPQGRKISSISPHKQREIGFFLLLLRFFLFILLRKKIPVISHVSPLESQNVHRLARISKSTRLLLKE